MASHCPGAVQVGSYFVGQYYQVLQQQPELVHQFYSNGSTMMRVDGHSSQTASEMLQIHTMILSLNFTAIEVKTIKSLESWNRGILVMVSGMVKTKEFSNRRKFVQTFFLAPQEKGYFVLNDIFQFVEDGAVYHHPTQLNASNTLPEPQASDYFLEQEARQYVDLVHIEDDPVEKYSLPDQQKQYQQEDVAGELVVEETAFEEASAPHKGVVDAVQEPPVAAAEEPVEEATKKTYASILRFAKESSVPVVATQSAANKSYEWNQALESTASQPTPPPSAVRQPNASSPYVPEYGVDTADNGFGFEDVEFKSVYVRNLPSTITVAEIDEEFKNFGTIKPDGIFIRNRKDVIGVCYAFVEFEDMVAVENAIKASPIQLAGRQVFIEERRPNSIDTRGGRRGGRVRGGYPAEPPRGQFASHAGLGRGSYQDGGDYRPRGNGFYRCGSR